LAQFLGQGRDGKLEIPDSSTDQDDEGRQLKNEAGMSHKMKGLREYDHHQGFGCTRFRTAALARCQLCQGKEASNGKVQKSSDWVKDQGYGKKSHGDG
jgi:hypothetical protein